MIRCSNVCALTCAAVSYCFGYDHGVLNSGVTRRRKGLKKKLLPLSQLCRLWKRLACRSRHLHGRRLTLGKRRKLFALKLVVSTEMKLLQLFRGCEYEV